MSSKPHRQTLATPSQIDHDALIAGFIDASGLTGAYNREASQRLSISRPSLPYLAGVQ